MATHAVSRPNPPQLPPLRRLTSPPSSFMAMGITGVDRTTVSASAAGTLVSNKKLELNRPLPQPPALYPAAVRSAAPPGPQHAQRPTSPALSFVSRNEPFVPPRSPTASHHRRNSSAHFFMRSNLTSLVFSLQVPNVLHNVLRHLEWPDAYTLFTTCKHLFNLFQTIETRDVILARFLPEYAYIIQCRDMTLYKDIPVTALDLDLLLLSQRIPLHRYPLHALKIQSAMLPTLEDDAFREKLVALTQAHSRFVLLLQSIVHSSRAPLPSEAEEGTYRPRFSPIQSLRELTFPAPLAYTEPPAPPPKGMPEPEIPKTKHPRHRSSASILSRRPTLNLPQAPRPSADAASSMISTASIDKQRLKKGRRLSIFGGKKNLQLPSPPPPDEPRALRVYASSWRKTSYWANGSVDFAEEGFSTTDSLKRPRLHRRFGSGTSSESSLSPSPLSQSRSRQSMFIQPEARSSSPHDLILATSRVRAPILRVFVPCTKLDTDCEALVKCEQQLVDSGLWSHLSTGDIVCNLGYVPPSDDSGSSDGDSSGGNGEFIMMRPGASGSANSSLNPAVGSSQKWLLFNGQVLVPYTPPDLLPLDQPFNLPTPFYYHHIMPPFTNLSYIIKQLPQCDNVPHLQLVSSSKKVRSPHSPNGFAMVKKHSWIARVARQRTEADGEMGEGWFGEWILEGEGTPEGLQLLLNALKGQSLGHREWEFVRDKSGGGKLWLRLLTIC